MLSGRGDNVQADGSYFDADPQLAKIIQSNEVLKDTSSLSVTWDTNVEIEYYPDWRTKKGFICPRGIYLHRGNPSIYGRQCMKAQGDIGNEYVDEEVLNVLVIKKRVNFK
jgi:hypothetical protein